MTRIFFILFVFSAINLSAQNQPFEIAVIGLSHDHVHGIMRRKDQGDFKIVGIVEANKALAKRYSDQYHFPMSIVYGTMDELTKAVRPEAVAAFGSIYDHLAVVEKFAPLGIHVMVEKPLAVSFEHATKMAALAKKHNIHLITNYETTWYPTNHKAYELLKQGAIGDMKKVIVRDGHKGPKKIGITNEFIEWLTDPVQNGGGAIIDFGCYGANLVTWLQNGKRPNAVTALAVRLQPEDYPKVDDDATIILNYDDSQANIQASWNWPIARKEMEIYGTTGALYADNRQQFRMRTSTGYSQYEEEKRELEELASPYNDAFAFFAAVVRGEVKLQPYDLSSLENNLLVVEILDAAVQSAKTGKTVFLRK